MMIPTMKRRGSARIMINAPAAEPVV
jgi:hypothetical protein